MMRLTVQPNVPTPPHSHPHEQMGIVVEGEGDLYIDGEIKHISEGTSFWVPPNAAHNFDATGDKPAEVKWYAWMEQDRSIHVEQMSTVDYKRRVAIKRPRWNKTVDSEEAGWSLCKTWQEIERVELALSF